MAPRAPVLPKTTYAELAAMKPVPTVPQKSQVAYAELASTGGGEQNSIEGSGNIQGGEETVTKT